MVYFSDIIIFIVNHSYKNIISLENLYLAWEEFIKDKKNKKDISEFSVHLSKNIYDLHLDLKHKTYKHSAYKAFSINDPKPRDIHKAVVRDRLLHHAIYRILYPYFDTKFIYDSYSCRNLKGTHRALNRLRVLARRVSFNHHKTCWVLKCDIRKFFASIDHDVLYSILKRYSLDADTLWLVEEVIRSFDSCQKGKGLPLGNLTSQLLVNVYMNEFDQHVTHKLKVKYYIRYADDFVFLSRDKKYLESLLSLIGVFLRERLSLGLHPNKVSIETFSSGIDFLGWVHFPDHRVLRTTTKRRMFKRVQKDNKREVVESYLGLLKHGNGRKLQDKIRAFYDDSKVL
jgi:RNA-directed DNA polymerase